MHNVFDSLDIDLQIFHLWSINLGKIGLFSLSEVKYTVVWAFREHCWYESEFSTNFRLLGDFRRANVIGIPRIYLSVTANLFSPITVLKDV